METHIVFRSPPWKSSVSRWTPRTRWPPTARAFSRTTPRGKTGWKNQEDVLDRQAERSDITVLLFYLHPWEFEPMPETFEYDEGVFHFRPELVQNCGEAMSREFDRYIQLCGEAGFRFATCGDFARRWEEAAHG
jgi:hypothetical protein